MTPLETGGGENKLNWCYACGTTDFSSMSEIEYSDHVKITLLCDPCVPRVQARVGVKDVKRWEHDD